MTPTASTAEGNTGEPVARDDAEDSLAFAEALLDHVYVLRKRFEAFKKRLDK